MDWIEVTMDDLTIQCAWCKETIKEGDPNKISHGICPKCFEKEFGDEEVEEKEALIDPGAYSY